MRIGGYLGTADKPEMKNAVTKLGTNILRSQVSNFPPPFWAAYRKIGQRRNDDTMKPSVTCPDNPSGRGRLTRFDSSQFIKKQSQFPSYTNSGFCGAGDLADTASQSTDSQCQFESCELLAVVHSCTCCGYTSRLALAHGGDTFSRNQLQQSHELAKSSLVEVC
jgi:hypothetical protein